MFSIERYENENLPVDGGDRTFPTDDLMGTGWLVRKDGEIVYADAFRRFCLEYVARQEKRVA